MVRLIAIAPKDEGEIQTPIEIKNEYIPLLPVIHNLILSVPESDNIPCYDINPANAELISDFVHFIGDNWPIDSKDNFEIDDISSYTDNMRFNYEKIKRYSYDIFEKLMDGINGAKIWKLEIAGQTLEFEHLSNIIATWAAEMISNMSSTKINEFLQHPCDFTEEEKSDIENNNTWIYPDAIAEAAKLAEEEDRRLILEKNK